MHAGITWNECSSSVKSKKDISMIERQENGISYSPNTYSYDYNNVTIKYIYM